MSNLFNIAPIYLINDSLLVSVIVLFLIGLVMGFVSTLFGIGGGFFYTPFFHSVLNLSAAQAVATSLAQMPFLAIGGVLQYAKKKKILYREAAFLLLGSIPTSQLIANSLGNIGHSTWGKTILFGKVTNADVLVASFFCTMIFSVGVYNIIKSNKFNCERSVLKTSQSLLFRENKKYFIQISLVGIGFGFVQSMIGIGGGFFAMPFFIYVCKKEPIEAVATSLLCIFVTASVTMVQFAYLNQLFLGISLLTATGSLIGSYLGSRWALSLPSNRIVKLLGYLQIFVVFLYLYIKFF